MKKILSLFLAAIMILSASTAAVAATSYGSEWDGYYKTPSTTYSDVSSTHWAYDAIMRVTDKNWFGGYPDGSFRPDGSITRAEALKVFVVFLSLQLQDVTESTYYDVDANAWYAPYIEAGKELFPVHTSIQGRIPFQPDMPVTREDTIYALVKALGCNVGVKYVDQSDLNMFSDIASISASLKSDFAIALQHDLVSGFPDGTIRAQDPLTRAEFATLLLRGTEHGFHDKYESVIESVTVTPSGSVEMTIGETVNLSARATYTDGTNQAYTALDAYDATNNGVISVSGSTITALKAGTATVKYNDSYLKNVSLNVIVKEPTDAPTLKIIDYDEVTEEASATVKGSATDKNGSVDLTCNGKDVAVGADGSFSTSVALNVGSNTVNFVAVNKFGVETKKTITIERTKAEATVPSEDEEKEDKEDGKDDGKDDSTSTGSSGNDGTPYLTFDKSTGTITNCGTSAADIVIPEQIEGVNVYHIADGAFKTCKYLETVELPDGLKSIGSEAFYGCTRLLEIEIPEGVKTIGKSAFENCKSLAEVILPESLKLIDDGVFYGCKRLTSVSFSEGITSIGSGAFSQCTSLAELELPETVTEIGDGAFLNCGNLNKIIIPDGVNTIADDAFLGCNGLTIYASVNSYAIEYAKDKGIAWEVI